jgi:predicted ATPase
VLTRIEIDGFKTFKDFALDVPPFLVVLGQNAAGKSNLFDAIAFLSLLARGETVMQAVRESRGQLTELLHRDSAGGQVPQMRFALEFGWPDAGEQVRCELELRVICEPEDPQGTQSLVVGAERFWTRDVGAADSPWRRAQYTPVWEPEDDDRSAPYPASRAFRAAAYPAGPAAPLAEGLGAERVGALGPEVPPHPVLDLTKPPSHGLVRQIRREIASWRVLAPEPSSLRRPDSYDDENRLSSSGAHLPNALSRIARRVRTGDDRPEGVLNDIRNDLATVIPEVFDLRIIDIAATRTRTVMVAARGEGEFTADAASDGTLRALAILAVVDDPDEFGLLCLEEPENGVYPQRLERLVELLRRRAADGRQVIVSSHSPALLSALPLEQGRALRDDAVYFTIASRLVGEERTVHRVTVVHPLRADVRVPLPEGLPGPVMGAGEIEAFLGVGGSG